MKIALIIFSVIVFLYAVLVLLIVNKVSFFSDIGNIWIIVMGYFIFAFALVLGIIEGAKYINRKTKE